MLWVNSLAVMSGLKAYWMGATRISAQGPQRDDWKWTNGQPVKYFNWRTGQPNACCGYDVD
ncbi:unnamed protein product, partial [Anisakis simplex]|uniref:C-type lectin domain-containing protein n=1 Tax=Anisakis simplex TaxID=6269 RepID=A0A0M3JNZ6_ANISI